MKHKSSNSSRNLINEFLKSQVYIGLPKSQTHKSLNSYLYGFRNTLSVLKTNHIFCTLKQITKIFSYLLQKEYEILFLGFPLWLDSKWKFLEKTSNFKYKFFNNNNDSVLEYLTKNSSKVGLVFIFHNFSKTSKVLNITQKLCLPTSGFLNSTDNSFDFPIVGNFKSKQSIFFFYSILLNTLKKN